MRMREVALVCTGEKGRAFFLQYLTKETCRVARLDGPIGHRPTLKVVALRLLAARRESGGIGVSQMMRVFGRFQGELGHKKLCLEKSPGLKSAIVS